MMVTRELLDKQNLEIVTYINTLIKDAGLHYELHIEQVNGLTFVKNQYGKIIARGLRLEVYNQMHVVRRFIEDFL